MGNKSYYRANRIAEEIVSQIPHLIEVEKLTQTKTAERLGISKNTVEKYCKKHGLKTQRTGPRNGELHTGWKGGVKYMKGYKYVYSYDHPNRTHDNYMAEHRLVMEQKLGRLLDRKEVVHHIDGNPLNNQPDNLMVFGSNKEHLAVDLKGKVPNWTPDGKERINNRRRNYSGMLAYAQQKKKTPEQKQETRRIRYQRKRSLLLSESNDGQQLQLSCHPS